MWSPFSAGVKSYLLKPVGKEPLIAELAKVRTEWLKARQEKNQAIAYIDKLRSQLPGLRAAFLEDWLNRKDCPPPATLQESFEFLAIPFHLELSIAVAVLELDIEEGGKYVPSDLHLLQFGMYKITEELLDNRGITYLRGNGQTVLLAQINQDETLNAFIAWIEMAKHEITRFLKVTVTVGIGAEITLARGS